LSPETYREPVQQGLAYRAFEGYRQSPLTYTQPQEAARKVALSGLAHNKPREVAGQTHLLPHNHKKYLRSSKWLDLKKPKIAAGRPHPSSCNHNTYQGNPFSKVWCSRPQEEMGSITYPVWTQKTPEHSA
jgi:hypothetical protein